MSDNITDKLVNFETFMQQVKKVEQCTDELLTDIVSPINEDISLNDVLRIAPYSHTEPVFFEICDTVEYQEAKAPLDIYSIWKSQIAQRILPFFKNAIATETANIIDSDDDIGIILHRSNGSMFIFNYSSIKSITFCMLHESLPAWFNSLNEKIVAASAIILSNMNLWRLSYTIVAKFDNATDSMTSDKTENEYTVVLNKSYLSDDDVNSDIAYMKKCLDEKQKIIEID